MTESITDPAPIDVRVGGSMQGGIFTVIAEEATGQARVTIEYADGGGHLVGPLLGIIDQRWLDVHTDIVEKFNAGTPDVVEEPPTPAEEPEAPRGRRVADVPVDSPPAITLDLDAEPDYDTEHMETEVAAPVIVDEPDPGAPVVITTLGEGF
jgi:hypothetical protein